MHSALTDAATMTRRLGLGPTACRLTAELRLLQMTSAQAAAAAGLGTARAQEARTARELSDAVSHILLAPAEERADLELKLTVMIAAGEAAPDDALAFLWLYLRTLHTDLTEYSSRMRSIWGA